MSNAFPGKKYHFFTSTHRRKTPASRFHLYLRQFAPAPTIAERCFGFISAAC